MTRTCMLSLLLVSCSAPPPVATGRCAGAAQPTGEQLTRELLRREKPRYRAALRRARGWLDQLDVDPVALRRRGIKGKKKLVEILEAYIRLYDAAPATERPPLKRRMEQLVAITRDPSYHDMATIDDSTFKQDSTSYLRAALLMEKLGLDTAGYRAEIAKIKPRLDGQMASRGSHQQMVFHWYYRHFGLAEPFPLGQGYRRGLIAHRIDPYRLRAPMQIYNLTHEVFVPYEYGDRLDATFFNEEDRRYLARALDRLTVYRMMLDDADLTAELVTCMDYLGLTHGDIYREALHFLLRAQHPDGKWGRYERYRKTWGDLVNQAFYLHTTSVALDALYFSFKRAPKT